MQKLASAPARICLVGEDLDWLGGTSVQAAINLRVSFYCMWKSAPCSFTMSSLGVINDSTKLSDIWVTPEPLWAKFISACAVWQVHRSDPLWPSEVTVRSEIPPAAGLASSAALCVAGVAASSDTCDFERLARDCWFVEREVLSRDVGPMDYLPCISGGVIGVGCGLDGVEWSARLNWPNDTKLIIVDTLTKRDTSRIISWKRNRWAQGDPGIDRYTSKTRELALLLKEFLSEPCPGLREIGDIITRAHVSLRDDMGVSNTVIEDCVKVLLRNGAVGAKVTGTGKGGCVFGVVHDTDIKQVVAAIKHMSVNVMEADVDKEGVKLVLV